MKNAGIQETEKVVVMTGASGGIGRALLETWRNEDARLYLVGRHGAKTLRDLLAADRESRAFQNAKVFAADLALDGAAQELAEQILAALRDDQGIDVPRIDSLVCAAGADLMTPESKSLDFNARLALAWKVDVAAHIALARSLGDAMRRYWRAASPRSTNAAPCVLFFSWDGADRGLAGESGQIYATCKGALASVARSLAHDLAPDVRVNCVAPGWIQTTWGAQASEKASARAAEQSLLGRWGRADEIAKVARFLLDPDASFVNAQTIAVNGGFNAR